jgi:hypothetical protein
VIAVVTGFVPIPDHPRREEEYRWLGEKLMSARISNSVCMFAETRVKDCWLYKYLEWRNQEFTHSVSDNPQKNSPAYHIVQAQKTEFLLDAATSNLAADVFVWFDFGIYHLKGLNDQIIADFLERAQYEQAIAIPGCWDKGYTYNELHPCWRFCGGVWVVPRRHIIALDVAMKSQYIRHIERTNNLVWEVSILAELEKERPDLPIWWYGPCDHDSSMFTKYQGSGLHKSEERYSVLAN